MSDYDEKLAKIFNKMWKEIYDIKAFLQFKFGSGRGGFDDTVRELERMLKERENK